MWWKVKGKSGLIRLVESIESCPELNVNVIKHCDALWKDVDQVTSDNTHEVTSDHLKLVT